MSGEWITPNTLAFIKRHRSEGVCFASIAAGLGVSTNAVIGASHRANFPRPRRAEPHIPWTPAEVAVLSANSTLLMPELVKLLPGRTGSAIQRKRNSLNLEGPVIGLPGRAVVRSTLPRVAATSLTALVAAHPPPLRCPTPTIPTSPPVARFSAPLRCQFPLGTPGQRDFRWCDGPIEQPGPYCEGCRSICYVRVRDRREDAA